MGGGQGDFAKQTAERAFERFSKAFDRWRTLYQGARTQLEEANRRSEMHGLKADERKDAKVQQAQANEQIALLERGNANGSSTSIPTATSPPKVSCRVTTSRACRSMHSCRQ